MKEEEQKDTLPSAAPQGTPAPTETQVVPPAEGNSAPPSAPQGTPEEKRKWADKYESPEELEKAYKSAESKIGQKSYAETIGQRVIEATGYTIRELEDAGYSPDQIVQAVISYQDKGQRDSNVTVPDAVRRTVEDSKVDKLEWKFQTQEFFADNPEAKQFKEELDELHSMPKYKDMSPSEIFEKKLKKFIEKSEQIVQGKQSEKERATIGVSNTPIPETKESSQRLKQFNQTGRFDDAVSWVSSFLRGK